MDFDSFFGQAYGPRWTESLRPALAEPPPKVYMLPSSGRLEFSDGQTPGAYALDRASLEPVFALDLRSGHTFLDLCSAPGGKALAALLMTGGEIDARLNDLSPARVARLKAVLFDHLPEVTVQALKITCSDGARIGQKQADVFERVLADVPCSSERHHVRDGTIGKWNPGASKRLAVRQHALLCSAFDATVPGGRIVYSTCSLSPFENDGVITKLMKSRKGQFEIVPSAQEMGESTEFGKIVLPDKHQGAGPIYYCILSKHGF